MWSPRSRCRPMATIAPAYEAHAACVRGGLLVPLVARSQRVPAKKDAAQTCVARYHVQRDGAHELEASVRAVDTDATKMSPAGMVEVSPVLKLVPIAAVENFHAVLWQVRDGKAVVVSRDYASDLD